MRVARSAGTVGEVSFHAPVALTPAPEQDAPSRRIAREQVEVLILPSFQQPPGEMSAAEGGAQTRGRSEEEGA